MRAHQHEDHPVVFGECGNADIAAAGQLQVAALQSNPKFKWVEVHYKKGDAKTVQIIAHTYPKHLPSYVLNGMD